MYFVHTQDAIEKPQLTDKFLDINPRFSFQPGTNLVSQFFRPCLSHYMVCSVFARRGELVIGVVQDLVCVVFIDAPRVKVTSIPQSIDAIIGFRAGTIPTHFNTSADIHGREYKF